MREITIDWRAPTTDRARYRELVERSDTLKIEYRPKRGWVVVPNKWAKTREGGA